MKTRLSRAASEDSARRLLDRNLWKLRSACAKNARRLLSEASLLIRNKHCERAFFLAFTALEELGKYLVVSDYITGVASEAEFRDVFRKHPTKIAYAHSNAQLELDKDGKVTDAVIVYDKERFRLLTEHRNQSLYVGADASNTPLLPSACISDAYAKKMIERARQEFRQIMSAEALTERIGSKALYK